MSLKATVKSSWTPLSQDLKNNQIFYERKELVLKWFKKWTFEQRKLFFEDLFSECSPKQLEFSSTSLQTKAPVYHKDFTSVLPKVISLHIFSFLDPRSLCRAMQVSSHWKFLAESDEIWLPKCVRLGWLLSSAMEIKCNLWKQLYIENIKALQIERPIKEMLAAQKEEIRRRTEAEELRKQQALEAKRKQTPPAWRGPDPVPKDTYRNNYLNNDDEIEHARKLRQKGMTAPKMPDRVLTSSVSKSITNKELDVENIVARKNFNSKKQKNLEDVVVQQNGNDIMKAKVPAFHRPKSIGKSAGKNNSSPSATSKQKNDDEPFNQNSWIPSQEKTFDSD